MMNFRIAEEVSLPDSKKRNCL